MLKSWLAISLLLLTARCVAQEVGYLDLTGVKPRTMLRFPPAPPPPAPVCKNGLCAAAGISGAHIGAVIGCGAGDRNDPRALKTTVTWLDQMDYQVGDDIAFEVRLENTGSQTMLIPWTPHLADLQPSDESQPFDYLELDLVLDIRTGSDLVTLPLTQLYGTKAAANAIVELPPGAWVRIRSSAKLAAQQAIDKHMAQEPDAGWMANVRFSYRHDSFHPQIGGYSEEINNDYPRSQQGDPLRLHIYPAAERTAVIKSDH